MNKRKLKEMVVYYLPVHEQTSQIKVWQCEKKVMSDSPGLVDFVIELVK